MREIDATVVAVDAAAGRVALDRSAFYPGGGGQPGDLYVVTHVEPSTLFVVVDFRLPVVWSNSRRRTASSRAVSPPHAPGAPEDIAERTLAARARRPLREP